MLFCFLGPHFWHMEVPRLGVNWSCSCRPVSQPQQWQIRAASVTYTTAYGNVESLPYWVRPGIESISSWMLVGFVTTEPGRELPLPSMLILEVKLFMILNLLKIHHFNFTMQDVIHYPKKYVEMHIKVKIWGYSSQNYLYWWKLNLNTQQ